jgi:hypothetical protein
MKRAFNIIVDFLAFVGLVGVAATGAIIRWGLPPGSESQQFRLGRVVQVKVQGDTLLGLDRANWSEIHFWLAAAFVCVLAFHFILNWSKPDA